MPGERPAVRQCGDPLDRVPPAGASASPTSFMGSGYPAPRNLNYWWNFGSLAGIALVLQIMTGIVLAMHYISHVDYRVRQRRAHHARRQLRLAAALRPRQRRLDVLHRGLHPPLPRAVLRLLQGAARAAVDARRGDPAADDGHRVHGLRAALGPDELLGGDRDHQPVLGDPALRREHRAPGCGAASRSTTRRSAASTRCTICCRS